MKISQPIPHVSRNDVERIVQRDFPHDDIAEILSILDAYGIESEEAGKARVQLAILKIANGNIDILRKKIGAAMSDYRDVLLEAEYPECARNMFRTDNMSLADQQKIVDNDWAQYSKWLGNP
ncbi:hypothetical protein M2447_001755 [Ereboglobus sp. PH5-10]|uniref:hypothetical protein n=1 Tax=Ereboglobus sp. PH5-10 TaxID=2940629 RepID=UPI0024064668|nr:hypothetical protein [Ereboglobus sp. PH5-10]MDF9827656.1 hypothetical protein [Ereboglobus sp. PH5-10]